MNPWLTLGFETARLAFAAQHVIALRLIRLAAGGAAARTEFQNMTTDKMAAMAQAGAAATAAAIAGGDSAAIARKVLRTYKKRVDANKRRLSRR
jgi:hypothetical protein